MFDHETFLNVQARHGGKVISNISRFKVRKKFFKLEYGGKESRGIPENHENCVHEMFAITNIHVYMYQ